MSIRDRINKLLGGEAVGGFAPDKETGKDGDELDSEIAQNDLRSDIEANKLAAFDRLSDADDSRNEADYR